MNAKGKRRILPFAWKWRCLFSIRSIVTVVTRDLVSFHEFTAHRRCSVRPHFWKRRPSIVWAVTCFARCGISVGYISMIAYPRVFSRVHTVRSPCGCVWHTRMTSRTLSDGSCMSLNRHTHTIVRLMGRVDSMGWTMTCFTLQVPMSRTETVETHTCWRCM